MPQRVGHSLESVRRRRRRPHCPGSTEYVVVAFTSVRGDVTVSEAPARIVRPARSVRVETSLTKPVVVRCVSRPVAEYVSDVVIDWPGWSTDGCVIVCGRSYRVSAIG